MSKGSKEQLLDYEKDDGRGPLWWVWDILKTWAPALLAVFAIRSAVAEPFRIPSGSMVPTLEIGDHILVSKFKYGLRIPFTDVEVLALGEPVRGDVIVFRYPPNPELDYIKRIVGVSGDRIELRDNTVYVNGEKATRTYVDEYRFVDDRCTAEDARLYKEDLLGVQHSVLTSPGSRVGLANYGPTTVPDGSYFVMGDNRDNSADSRVWGIVPRDHIKGKAVLVWLSYDNCNGDIPVLGMFREDRLGELID